MLTTQQKNPVTASCCFQENKIQNLAEKNYCPSVILQGLDKGQEDTERHRLS